jgi:hypothetical protein
VLLFGDAVPGRVPEKQPAMITDATRQQVKNTNTKKGDVFGIPEAGHIHWTDEY